VELIVAVQELARPGGPQTYALTVAEQLARLGHGVTLFARELGAMTQVARERCLNVTSDMLDLPERADGVLVGVDRSLAFELAERYPNAARVFIVHSIDDIHLPPPVDGVGRAQRSLRRARLGVRGSGRGRSPAPARRPAPLQRGQAARAATSSRAPAGQLPRQRRLAGRNPQGRVGWSRDAMEPGRIPGHVGGRRVGDG